MFTRLVEAGGEQEGVRLEEETRNEARREVKLVKELYGGQSIASLGEG